MQNPWNTFGLVLGAAALLTGCADAEKKLGRGMVNMTEIARGGEFRRSYEQTTLWDGPESGRTVGVIHGVTRTVARTGVGVYEVLTFPIKSDPIIKPVGPVYPDSYKPRRPSSPTMSTDRYMGFSGGDIMPLVPGSTFRVFE